MMPWKAKGRKKVQGKALNKKGVYSRLSSRALPLCEQNRPPALGLTVSHLLEENICVSVSVCRKTAGLGHTKIRTGWLMPFGTLKLERKASSLCTDSALHC